MVMEYLIKFMRRKSGQELLEFAITLPLLLLIVFGIFDLGRVVYYASALQNAAREGARYGIVNPYNNAQIYARVKQRSLGLGPSNVSVELNDVLLNDATEKWPCDKLLVTVSYTFNPVTPFIGSFLPGGNANITLSSELQRERWLYEFGQPDYGCDPDP